MCCWLLFADIGTNSVSRSQSQLLYRSSVWIENFPIVKPKCKCPFFSFCSTENISLGPSGPTLAFNSSDFSKKYFFSICL